MSSNKETRLLMETWRKFMNESKFSELSDYEKNRGMQIYDALMDPVNVELRDEVFQLIDQSYSYIGGNASIRKPDDLADSWNNDYTTFIAWDIDADPEPDVIRGLKPKAGKKKLAITATDGSPEAASFSGEDTASRLSDGSHYAEMSGRAATAQMKRGTPAVTDEMMVRSLLPGKEITWFGVHPSQYEGDDPVLQSMASQFTDAGSQIEAKKAMQYGPNGEYDGWYVRSLGGSPHAKLIFGAV